jgi:hypothetical protein
MRCQGVCGKPLRESLAWWTQADSFKWRISKKRLNPSRSLAPHSIPTVRDQLHGGEKIVFQNTVLPRYLRKVDEVTDLIPFFSLKGISITEIPEVFRQMSGKDVPGLSISAVSKLLKSFTPDHKEWRVRDMQTAPNAPTFLRTASISR